jgi:hypothetical protein
MLDSDHQLYKLSEVIDWASLEIEISKLLNQAYAPQWRLVSAVIYLKSFYDLSSSQVIEKWIECPYHRFFCSGEVDCKASVEDEVPFPISKQVLDTLSFEMIGDGHEAMIKALLAKTRSSPTIH